MADLDTAAADLLVQLKGLEAQITRAQHELSELDEQLSTSQGHLDGEWTGVEERFQALLAKVEEEKEKLEEEGQGAETSLNEVGAAAHAAQAEEHGALQQASSGLAAFSEHLSAIDPQVESMGQPAISAAQALAEGARSAETALEAALAQARDLLQDQVAGDLQHMQQEIQERAERLRHLIGEEEARLDQACADWAEKLGEVEGMVEHAFADAHDHAREVVSYSVEELEHEEQAEAEQLSSLLSVLEGLLDNLHSEAEECSADVGEEGKHALDDGLSTLQSETASALASLHRVKDLLAKFAFVSL